MTSSTVEALLKPSYELLSKYERSLNKLEKAVEEDNPKKVKNYSLQTAQYLNIISKNIPLSAMEMEQLPFFHKKDLEEYNNMLRKFIRRARKSLDRTKSIDGKINEKYKKYEKEKKDTRRLIDAGYIPVISHYEVFENKLRPQYKRRQMEEEFEEAFGKDIIKEHKKTSGKSYA